jgi:hypothetical protein
MSSLNHAPVEQRRVVEGETFGFPHPRRWPGGSKRSRDDRAHSERRWPAWKVVTSAFIAALLVLLASAFFWVGVYVFSQP